MTTLWPIVVSQTGLIVAPAFLAAQDYMIIGRVMSFVGKEYGYINHTKITKIFVGADIFAILTQAGGGSMLVRARPSACSPPCLTAHMSLVESTLGRRQRRPKPNEGRPKGPLDRSRFASYHIRHLLLRRHCFRHPFVPRPSFATIQGANEGHEEALDRFLHQRRVDHRTKHFPYSRYVTCAPDSKSLHSIEADTQCLFVEFAEIKFTPGNDDADGYLLNHEWPMYVFDSILIFVSSISSYGGLCNCN